MSRFLVVLVSIVFASHCKSTSKKSVPSESVPSETEANKSGFQIINGTRVNNETIFKRVFEVLNSQGVGTASNIIYPRCLLSAEHVDPQFIVRGPNVSVDGNGNITYTNGSNIFQEKETSRTRGCEEVPSAPPLSHDPGVAARCDLRVTWYKNLQGAERITEPTMYEPMQIGPLESLGLTAEPFWTPGVLPQSVEVFIYGFGATALQGATPINLEFRTGATDADTFGKGSISTPQMAGSYLRTLGSSRANGRSAALGGDSGGPVISLNSKVVAVISKGIKLPILGINGNVMYYDFINYMAGLDQGVVQGQAENISNFEWAKKTAEKICAKRVIVSASCGGKVNGAISPRNHHYTEDFFMNNIVHTSPLTCAQPQTIDTEEIVHADQTLNLEAVPHPGFQFKEWLGTNCRCPDKFAPVCPLPYSEIGKYTASESTDHSTCQAAFTWDGELLGVTSPPIYACNGLASTCVMLAGGTPTPSPSPTPSSSPNPPGGPF